MYYAIRSKTVPDYIRIEKARDAIEALYIAFGRDRRGGNFEALNLGTRKRAETPKCIASLKEAKGWTTI